MSTLPRARVAESSTRRVAPSGGHNTLGSVLASTRNLLANLNIPIRVHSLSELSLSAQHLAQQQKTSPEDQHLAELFFAQHGCESQSLSISREVVSPHAPFAMSQPTYTPAQLDFDIDQYIDNQQDVLITNVLNSSLVYQQLQAADLFNNGLTSGWDATKQQLLQSAPGQDDLSLGLPVSPLQPTSNTNTDASIDSAAVDDLLALPQDGYRSLSTSQDAYAQVFQQFADIFQAAYQSNDLDDIRKALLSVPTELVTVSRQMESLETAAAGSTLGSDHVDTASFNAQSALRLHEQSTEFWLWFETLSGLLDTQLQQQPQQSFDVTILSSSNDPTAAKSGTEVISRRAKSWFLPTSSQHATLSTIYYLQSAFIENITQAVSSNRALNDEYDRTIQNVQDDNQLMVELSIIYARTRDFQLRFLQSQRRAGGLSSHDNANLHLDAYSSQTQQSLHPNLVPQRENVWNYVFCCLRCGFFGAALSLLEEWSANQHRTQDQFASLHTSALCQILSIYVDAQSTNVNAFPTVPQDLLTQLYREMCTPVPDHDGGAAAYQSDGFSVTMSPTGIPSMNPFRRVVYSALGHFPIATHDLRTISPYVLVTIEDYIWFRLFLIASPQELPPAIIDSYRNSTDSFMNITAAGSSSHQQQQQQQTNPLQQLSLSHLQTNILQRGKNHFRSSANPCLYAHVLFLTQQYERCIIELYSINPPLGFHVGLMCVLYGLVRVTDLSAPLFIPLHMGSDITQQLYNSPSSPSSTSTLNKHNNAGYQFVLPNGQPSTQLAQVVLENTHHVQYAMNAFKFVESYAQAVQRVSSAYAMCYMYLIRLFPLFNNIQLYPSLFPVDLTSLEFTTQAVLTPDAFDALSAAHDRDNNNNNSSQNNPSYFESVRLRENTTISQLLLFSNSTNNVLTSGLQAIANPSALLRPLDATSLAVLLHNASNDQFGL